MTDAARPDVAAAAAALPAPADADADAQARAHSDADSASENETQADAEPAPAVLSMPVDLRSAALVVLAVLAMLAILHWARAFFIPIVLSFLFAAALAPLVERLSRWRLNRTLTAAMVMMTLVGLLGFGAFSLRDDAEAMIESLPETARKLARAVGVAKDSPNGAIGKVEEAAKEIERAVEAPPDRGAPPVVQVERPRVDVREYLWTGTIGLVTLLGQGVIVLFLTFFLLAGGNTFRRKLVTIAGPTFSRRRITVEMLDEIMNQVQRYLLINVLASLLVGVTTWLVFAWIGLEEAALWGVIAAVVNWMPYLGAIAVTGAASVAAFVQFDSLEMGLLVLGASMVINTLEGYLLMPWLTSRANKMSPVVVFVSVLAFGWLWGVWGLLLGVPMVVIVKSICDRIEDLRPIGELLGD
ncbi:MAG TPA: AI-2E family transporter [Albitalea sp.]